MKLVDQAFKGNGHKLPRNKGAGIVRIGLATVGLTCWAILFSIALFGPGSQEVPGDLNGRVFTNSLDFLLKISGLFLLFPFIFNLIALFGGLVLGKRWQGVSLDFLYNVTCEFGIFWALLLLAYIF